MPKTKGKSGKKIQELQLKMLRIQQGIWHQKRRAIVLFEGFDAAGKGGSIHRLVETLDPRGYQVVPIGPPNKEEQARHYLYRFWKHIPKAGTITIFDRSWYGRVLVEKVDKLTSSSRLHDAYREIREFEETLLNDGIDVIKIFLAIDKKEQIRRFEDRLHDPYKQWKLTEDDVDARSKWDQYVSAVEEMFKKTHSAKSPWHLIPANHKNFARIQTLSIVTENLEAHGNWMEDKAAVKRARTLEASLKELGIKEGSFK